MRAMELRLIARSRVLGLRALAMLAIGCAAPTGNGSAIALRDPLGLIDDVYASGNTLRLLVLPGDRYVCDPPTGSVTPEVADASVGATPDAVVDVELAREEIAAHEVTVPPGTWLVLVRGKGTDPGSGVMNTVIARGCAGAMVENGGTTGVTIALAPVSSPGVCGDALLSPDEQCEGTPECDAECRTIAEPINTTTAGRQALARVAARTGQQVVVVWESTGDSAFQRLMTADGRTIAAGGPLEIDEEIAAPAAQTEPAAAVAGDGRFAIAFADFAGAADGDVRVGFFTASRVLTGGLRAARVDRAGAQRRPVIAFAASGAAMVVFEDSQSATGLSGRIFDPTGAPQGAEAFPVGAGATVATAPAIAATAAGFAIAFESGGDVLWQRHAEDGTPIDPTAMAVEPSSGTREAPTVAANGDQLVIAWAEINAPGDAMGLGVRARLFDGAAAAGETFTVNTTIERDQGRPSAAAAPAGFLIAFESAGSVRARVIESTGEPGLNRERPPSFADFEVAPVATGPAAAAIGAGATAWWWIAFLAPGDGEDVFARRFPM
jgi:hypothetical protein